MRRTALKFGVLIVLLLSVMLSVLSCTGLNGWSGDTGETLETGTPSGPSTEGSTEEPKKSNPLAGISRIYISNSRVTVEFKEKSYSYVFNNVKSVLYGYEKNSQLREMGTNASRGIYDEKDNLNRLILVFQTGHTPSSQEKEWMRSCGIEYCQAV